MHRHLNGIDHCLILVRDLERAGEAFAGLGFTVAPLGRHGPEMGTGNRTIMLEEDYFELLGILEPTDYNRHIAEALSSREGMAAVALRTDDAAAAAAAARAAGIAVSEAQTVRRTVRLPGGSDVEAAFTIAHFTEATTPSLRLFCSQVHAREHTWLAELTRHENTAWGIDHVAIVTATPALLASDVSRIFDTDPRQMEGAVSVDTGGAPFIYTTREALAQRYPGVDLSAVPQAGPAVLSIKVHDADAAARCLQRAGVSFHATADGFLVPPRHACGVALILREVRKP